MKTLKTKTFSYNGENFEIKIHQRDDGTIFAKDYKINDLPFSPFFYTCGPDVNALELEAKTGIPVEEHLFFQAEQTIKFWSDNKDKL